MSEENITVDLDKPQAPPPQVPNTPPSEPQAEAQAEAQSDAPPEQGSEAEELHRKKGQDAVEKRIKSLTAKLGSESRRNQKLENDLNEAVSLLKRYQEQNQNLAAQVSSSAVAAVDARASRADAEVGAATEKLRRAHEAGDVAAIAKAQEEIAGAAAARELERRFKTQMEAEIRARPTQPPPQQQAPVYQTPRVQVDPAGQKWLEKNNDWFMDPGHEAKTRFAMGINDALLAKGMDPKSDTFYEAIDRELSRFDNLGDVETKPSGQVAATSPSRTVVAGTSSNQMGRPMTRKVQLTPSEQAVARRLGIPYEKYAAEKAKLT